MLPADRWATYWLHWEVKPSEPPPYWGPPPTDDEAALAISLGIPSQPTVEIIPVTPLMREFVKELHDTSRRVTVLSAFLSICFALISFLRPLMMG
jgi:hypothetical protein